MRPRGFTLVEVMTVCAAASVLAALAMPSYRAVLVRGQRSDATTALERLHAAEERYRAANGRYTDNLAVLGVPAWSDRRLYALAVQVPGDDTYTATATAVPGGGQDGDTGCSPLQLQVRSGFPTPGPDRRCWNR